MARLKEEAKIPIIDIPTIRPGDAVTVKVLSRNSLVSGSLLVDEAILRTESRGTKRGKSFCRPWNNYRHTKKA